MLWMRDISSGRNISPCDVHPPPQCGAIAFFASKMLKRTVIKNADKEKLDRLKKNAKVFACTTRSQSRYVKNVIVALTMAYHIYNLFALLELHMNGA